MEKELIHNIYTDGGCRPTNPGPGGYGVVELNDNIITAAYTGKSDHTTNNIMELTALYQALKLASSYEEKSNIYIDSAYAMNCITKWAEGWSKNGWINSKKEPVANKELIETIYNYYMTNFLNCKVELIKVKGHVGNVGNELVDALSRSCQSDFYKIISQNKLVVNYNKCEKNFVIFSS